MFAILKMLLGFIDPVSKITGQIADAINEYNRTQVDKKKIEVGERIKALEARRDVLIAESKTPINSIVRAILAAPVIIYLWKVIVWDKILGLGVTDDLSGNLWNFLFIVIGFYFLDTVVSRFKS